MQKTSGKFVLRVGSELHAKLKAKARGEGTSLNELCRRTLAAACEMAPVVSGDMESVIREAQIRFGNEYVGLVLFGSQARGDAHDLSDVDVLVVLETSRRISRDLYRSWPKEFERNRLELQFVHLPDQPETAGSLWFECALDGIVLHDPSGQIRRFLKNLKAWIASGNVVRKVTHGQGYWVHK